MWLRTVLTTPSEDSLFTKALMISTWYSISASRSSTPLFDNRYPAPTQPNPAIPAKKAMQGGKKHKTCLGSLRDSKLVYQPKSGEMALEADEVRACFDACDEDGDGHVSLLDLKRVFADDEAFPEATLDQVRR